MATTKFLCASKPLNFLGSSSSCSSHATTTFRCLSKGGLNREKRLSWTDHGEERKPTAAVVKASMATSESVITSEPQVRMIRGILELVCALRNANHAVLLPLIKTFKQKSLRQRLQLIIERIIMDCRFLTLFAVGGSLIGSVLCFVEGCFTISESYFQYFHALSQKSDEGHHVVLQLLIEAIDMFLVGTAMLMFGFGLYAMFVGSKTMKKKGPWLSGSNLFGLFYTKTLPAWVEMQSVSQAKSKLGHAVMMILQVGVLEKFKNIPLVTGLDLACFAGAVFISSACIFVLSRLSAVTTRDG